MPQKVPTSFPSEHLPVLKLFSLIQSHLFLSACVACAFGATSKTSLPRPTSWSFSLTFFSKSFTISGLTYMYVSNSFWVDFCELCKTGVQFHLFACEYPILPTPLIEETILSLLSSLDSFVKCHLTIYTWFLLGSWFCSIGPVSYTHLTLPTTGSLCRSRWSPYH